MGIVRLVRAAIVVASVWAAPWFAAGVVLAILQRAPAVVTLGMALTLATIGGGSGLLFALALALIGRTRYFRTASTSALSAIAAIPGIVTGAFLGPGVPGAILLGGLGVASAVATVRLASREQPPLSSAT